jgi:hypothetical protein
MRWNGAPVYRGKLAIGRFGLSGVMALVLFLAVAGSASACNLPTVSIPDKPVYSGDPVSYSITDLTSGATYTIKVGTDVVAHDVATSDGAVSGRFQMPDAGPSSRPVSVELIVDCGNPGEGWSLTALSPIQYAGQRPALAPITQGAPQSDAQSQPVGSAPHAPRPVAPPRPTSGPSPSARPVRTRRSPSGAPSARRSLPTSQHAPAQRAHTPASTSHGARAAAAQRSLPATRAAVVHRSSAEPASAVAASAHVAVPMRREQLAAVQFTHRDRALPSPHVGANGPPVRLASGQSPGSPNRALALLIGMLVAGGAVAFAYIRRRRPGEPVVENWAALYPPPPTAADQPIAPDPHPAMDAELHELIAEERARELSAEALSHAEPSD